MQGLNESSKRYSTVAMTLHWLIAAALAFQIGLGGRLEDLTLATGLFDATQFHKSVGITILLLSLLRLGWRWFKPPPSALPDAGWTHALSKFVHVGLYAFMIGAPLTGWLMVSTSKLDIDTMIFGSLFWPDIPFVGTLETQTKAALNTAAAEAHDLLAMFGIGLFLLHVAGALRHQLLRNEPLIARMWPGSLGLRRVAGTAIIALLFVGALALTAAGRLSAGNEPQNTESAEVEKTVSADIREKTVTSAESEDGVPKLAEAEDGETDAAEQTDETQDADEQVEDIVEESVETASPAARAYNWTVTSKRPVAFSFKWNGETVSGNFSDWNANIVFGPDALDQSSIDVTINLASAGTGNAQIDDALPGADFFAIAANPQARFRSSTITGTGGNGYEARGTLTLKGISQPVTLRFTLDIQGNTAKANGSASVNRIAHSIAEGGYGDVSENVAVSFSFSASH